jgi:hypothetical protein
MATTTEPVIKNSSSIELAEVGDDVLCRVALGRAVRNHVDLDRADLGEGVVDVDGGHVVAAGDGGDPGGEFGVVGCRHRHDLDRVGLAAGEALTRFRQLPGDRRAWERAAVGILEAGVQERHSGDDQQHAHDGDDRQRMALHPLGDVPEGAGAAAQLGRVKAVADERQQRGDQAEAGEDGDEHDADSADGERAQSARVEHEQPGQGDGHGKPGEGDRAAGGGHGEVECGAHVAAAGALFAESADDEQPVVDADADAEHRDDVDRIHRHVASHRRPGQHDQGAGHAGEGETERKDRRQQPAEHDDQGDEGQRQGEHLGAAQIGLGLRFDLVVGGVLVPDEHPRGTGALELCLDGVGHRVLVGVGRPVHRDDHRRCMAILCAQSGVVGAVGVGDGVHVGEFCDPGHGITQRGLGPGIVDVQPVDDTDHGRARARRPVLWRQLRDEFIDAFVGASRL